jgi:hypothetical protein
MGDLLPCPFCGGEADYLPDRLMAPGAEPPVFCDGCHASALDAAAWNRRASGWQPISTAPRDGTRVLCYAPSAEDRAAVMRNDYWWMQERGWASMRPGQPYTHWQPLPAAPAPQDPDR